MKKLEFSAVKSAFALAVTLAGLSAGAALVNHLDFNDAGNDGLNLLKATVGNDAEVKSGAAVAVAGIGNLTAVNGEGCSDGTGAVNIPSGQFLSLAHGVATGSMKPWCLVMRVRDPDATFQGGFKAFYSLVQDNSTDGELFRSDETTELGRSKYWFRYSDGSNTYTGDFAPSVWHTVVISFFGANSAPGSYCYLDDLVTPILKRKSANESKYPSKFTQDSLSGKPLIFFSADDDGEDCPLEFDDIKIYDEAAPAAVFGLGDVIKTVPWQQNVYTNRFTILCETKSVVDGLELQYGEGYAQSVAMTYVASNGGTYIYKASVQIDDCQGAEIPYRLGLAGGCLNANATVYGGTVKLWSDDPDESFSCAIWGDNQSGAKNGDWDADKFLYLTRGFEHMVSRNVDFGLSTGDMSGDADYSSQIWPCLLQRTNAILGKDRPYYLAWGNHDGYYDPDEEAAITPYFDLPSGSNGYYLYRGNVLFIFVHCKAYYRVADTTALKAWLADILATDRARSAKFRVLLQHAPMYLDVWNYEKPSQPEEHQALLETAKAGGVDIVFSGHMHGYEHIEKDGIIQLTNGGFGYLDHVESPLKDYGDCLKVGGRKNTPYLWARQSSNGVLGTPSPVHMGCIVSYGEMQVSGDRLTYLAHGFNADGSYIGVFDTVSITSKTVSAQSSAPAAPLPCADPDAFAAVTNAPCTKALWAQYRTAIGESYSYTGAGTDPVTGVSRDEVEAFCAWLNGERTEGLYRIPLESEVVPSAAVSLWTASSADNGWIATVGTATVYGTSKSAIATSGCSAGYLGFRLTTEPTSQENTWVTEPSLPRLDLYASEDVTVDLGAAADGVPSLSVDGEALDGAVIHTAGLAPGRHTLTLTIPKHNGWSQLVKEIEFLVEPDTLVSHYTFDDTNDLLKASVGTDGLIFQGRESVSAVDGLGQCTAVSGEGRSDGAGAIQIPFISNNSQFLAIPNLVGKTGGHPWCMVMKCYTPPMTTSYLAFYSLAQNNDSDAYLFCKKSDSYRLGSSQWDADYSKYTQFTENTWHTLVISCDGTRTRLWLDSADENPSDDGDQNWRDGSKDLLDGKDYIYICGDDDGDDGTMYFDDIKIYAESAPPTVFASSFREYFFDDLTAWSWEPVTETSVSDDETRWTFTDTGRLTMKRQVYGLRISVLDGSGTELSAKTYGCVRVGEKFEIADPGDGSVVVSAYYAVPAIACAGDPVKGVVPLAFTNVHGGVALVAAYGETDGGNDFSAWENVRLVKEIADGESSYNCDTRDWGRPRFARFYLVDKMKFPVQSLQYVSSREQKAMGVCTRYLDAQCRATKNTEISARVKLSNISAQSRVFVCNNIGSTMRVEMYINSSGYPAESCCGISAWSSANGVSKGLTTSSSYKVKTTDIATWTLNVYGKVASYKNGAGTVSQSGNTYFQPGELESSTVWFLGIPSGWTNMYAANGDLYSAYIKESGVFVRNFIPATGYRDNGDLVPGMFETVEGKFYPSAGSEEFTPGPARETPYTPAELGNVSFIGSTPSCSVKNTGTMLLLY